MKKIFYLLAFIGLIVGLIFLWRSDFFKIKKAACYMGQLACSNEAWLELNSLVLGKNILFLSSSRLQQHLESQNFNLKNVRVKKILPDQLTVMADGRISQVVIQAQEKYFLADEQGFVLAEKKTHDQKLPLILTSEIKSINVGEVWPNEQIIWLANLLTEMKYRLFMPQKAALISNRASQVWLENNLLAVFSSGKDIKQQLDSLQFIFSRAKIDGKSLKKIDLRFDKPVIIYE